MLGRMAAPGCNDAAYLSLSIVPRKYMQIGMPVLPYRPKSSPPMIGGRSFTLSSPKNSRNRAIVFRVSFTSLIVDGVNSSRSTFTSGSGAFAP